MIRNFFIFIIFNFAALGIGAYLMGEGPKADWYTGLNQAPWTPPGWAFGAAWTTIMICFSFYMAFAWKEIKNRSQLTILFAIQWILNVGWNPTFFKFHYVTTAMVIISLLTVLIGFILQKYNKQMKTKSILLMPYFLWLLVATSLNGYILFYN